MKILIATPVVFEYVPDEVIDAIKNLRVGSLDITYEILNGHNRAEARNAIVRSALTGSYDYVLMVDSDTVIPENTLKTFLSDPAPIILGMNPRGNDTNIYKPSDGFKDKYYLDKIPDGRFPIGGGMFSCALIHTDVFKHLLEPYFEWYFYEYGGFYPDDLYFCLKAKRAGYTIWADSRIRCEHLVRFINSV